MDVPLTGMEIREVVLKRMTFLAQSMVSEELLHSGNPVEFDFFLRDTINALLFHMRKDLWAQDIEKSTVSYPASWKDSVKEAMYAWLGRGEKGHFPIIGEALRLRFPVAYTEVTIECLALYTKFRLPKEESVMKVYQAVERKVR